MFRGAAYMDQICSSTSHRMIRLGSGRFRGKITTWALFCIPQAVPEQFLLCIRPHCPAGGAVPLGSADAMGGCTWSTTVFGWVV